MPRKNQEQPDVPPFEYRAGVTIPAIGGMYRRGDPTQIPPHRLHLGVNIRLADGETGSRDGLAHVEGEQEDACITGIFEIEDFSVGAYITELADGGLQEGTGLQQDTDFHILAFNEEKDPVSRNYWDDDSGAFPKVVPGPWRISQPTTTDCFQTFQRMNDLLLIANQRKVYQAEFSEDEQLPRMDLTQLFEIVEATGYISSMCVRRERVDDAQTGSAFDKDVLYLGCDYGEVWRYDGTTVELVHTLTSGGRMQIICYGGIGLCAAGDSAAGFSYQEQAGFAWADQAWGQDFNCNGLCEFLGEVVFVGDRTDGLDNWIGDALHWDLTASAPTNFASEGVFSALGNHARFRNPVVAGGALHWLVHIAESLIPPAGCEVHIARWEDFAVGDDFWADIGQPSLQAGSFGTIDDYGFFVPFAGGILFLMHSNHTGDTSAPTGQSIVLCFTGVMAQFDVIYNWPGDAIGNARLKGLGYEAIQL